jgi:hypothetical protein
MPTFTLAGQPFDLDRDGVERAIDDVLPDPIQEHYVIVGGRRYPPKQVLSRATGLDRADFTTHHARRVLKRLGFVAARTGQVEAGSGATGEGPHGGRQAEALAPFAGKWVALTGPTEVLVAADAPQDILAWLARHERRAEYGMFRVPSTAEEAGGAAPL